MPQTYTVSVSVKFTLYSTADTPPYEVAGCEGLISYNDNTPAQPFNGWNAENIGTPQPGGAAFIVNVADSDYSSGSNVTNVANWAITFIPRGGNSNQAQSPFSQSQNTIAGSGATNNNGVFTLNIPSNITINNTGDWDWSLMVQMVLADRTTIRCFSSDPEMEVGT